MTGLKTLLHSRKFWLSLAGAIGTVLVKVSTGDAVTAVSIAGVAISLVQAIAKEDAAEKSGPIQLQQEEVVH